jgi:hypothetical protein
MYGCETWSLTSREEHRLRVFENRVLRRIFGPKRDEVIGGWRKLHNEELHNLYCSPSIIRMIKPNVKISICYFELVTRVYTCYFVKYRDPLYITLPSMKISTYYFAK